MTGFDPHDPYLDRTYDPPRIVRRPENEPCIPLLREEDMLERGRVTLAVIAVALGLAAVVVVLFS